MFQRKPRRFRRRNEGRNNMPHNVLRPRIRPNQFSNAQTRNNFRQSLSAEKSFEKYTSLAKDAMAAGDKTLSENYLQHADHYMRVIENKNKNRIQAKDNITDKPTEENKNLSEKSNTDQNKEIKNKV